jgi:hypothetical protein
MDLTDRTVETRTDQYQDKVQYKPSNGEQQFTDLGVLPHMHCS